MNYFETEKELEKQLLKGHRQNTVKFFAFVGAVVFGITFFLITCDQLQGQILEYLK